MVCSTDQTALYSAVERYNSRFADIPEPRRQEKTEPPQENTAYVKPRDIPKPPNSGYPRSIPRRSPLDAIFYDRDMLLIAALIIILLHEKADIKLIAALAFVLIM